MPLSLFLAEASLQFGFWSTLFVIIPWIVTIGWVASRMLGIRIGFWRAAIAAALGWFIGLALAIVSLRDTSASATLIVLIAIAFGVLVTMPIVIVLDMVSRRAMPHRRRSRWWLHPLRAIKARFAPYGRLRELLRNARHENLLHMRYASGSAFASTDFARRLRNVLEESGGMMVKFGQIASTRTDVLPVAITTELSSLQSDVKAVPYTQVAEVIEQELGEPVDRAFASFDAEPLAAASIGQTHRARLVDGGPVVVKVQRPGIDELVARDASVLRLASRQLDRRVPAASQLGITDLVDGLVNGITEELDYTHEASAASKMRANRANDVGIAIPEVYSELSTDRVLVMEQVNGGSIADPSVLDASPVPRMELARRLLASFISQVFDDGLYHADPHPGNVLIDDAGTLWLLDFGAVGRLDATTHEAMKEMAAGFALSDASLVARGVRRLTGDDLSVDLRTLESDLSELLGNARGGIDPALFAEVLQVMQHHELRPPAAMSLLGRAMLTLQGTLSIISPEFDLAHEGNQLVRAEAPAMGTPEEIAQRELIRALPALRTLPEHAETIASQLRAGVLSIRTERYAGNDRMVVERWLDRILVAAMGSATVVASALVLVAGANTEPGGVRNTLGTLGFLGLAGGAILLLRTTAQALRRLPVRDD